jgi:hypothetical protein
MNQSNEQDKPKQEPSKNLLKQMSRHFVKFQSNLEHECDNFSADQSYKQPPLERFASLLC